MTWGSTYKTKLTKIRTKQNKCVQCIRFANSHETALPYYNLLEILTLGNIYKFRVAAFAQKILIQQTDIPEVFSLILKVYQVFILTIPGIPKIKIWYNLK